MPTFQHTEFNLVGGGTLARLYDVRGIITDDGENIVPRLHPNGDLHMVKGYLDARGRRSEIFNYVNALVGSELGAHWRVSDIELRQEAPLAHVGGGDRYYFVVKVRAYEYVKATVIERPDAEWNF